MSQEKIRIVPYDLFQAVYCKHNFEIYTFALRIYWFNFPLGLYV